MAALINGFCYLFLARRHLRPLFLGVYYDIFPSPFLTARGSLERYSFPSRSGKPGRQTHFCAIHIPKSANLFSTTCVIAACAQTLYALRVLRKHGLCDYSLHDVFRAVAVAKLMTHPTPGGDSPTPTTDRRSLLSFVAAFALVSVLQI